jgi:thiamine pyrophosphate-dependent acetolactate synthase large subunit-like protein
VLAESHPANFGASLPYRPIQQLISEADLVLAVGTEMGETDLFFLPKLALSGLLVRIDVDPVKLSDHYAADVRIWSDAREALQAINQALPSRATDTAAPTGWRTAIGGAAKFRSLIDADFTATAHAQSSVLRAIKAALPWDGVVFSDMTQIAYLGNYAYPVEHAGQWFHPSGYGTLGYALPAALGAKLSSPARAVIALAGDFGFQFTVSELMTAVETGVGLPIVIWNNSALGQIRDDMVAAGIPQLGVVGRNPDFVALARACGADGHRVHEPAALTATLRAALNRTGPTVIDVAFTGS